MFKYNKIICFKNSIFYQGIFFIMVWQFLVRNNIWLFLKFFYFSIYIRHSTWAKNEEIFCSLPVPIQTHLIKLIIIWIHFQIILNSNLTCHIYVYQRSSNIHYRYNTIWKKNQYNKSSVHTGSDLNVTSQK